MEQLSLLKIKEAESYIQGKIKDAPEVGLILGSGLGIVAKHMEDATVIRYADIPHFPVPTVAGHAGELVVGKIGGAKVLLLSGRFHIYEGHGIETVSLPVRVMKALGVRKLLVTNAAGGVNTMYRPGDLMLISDHINFMGRNPLIGPNFDEVGARFPDMSEAYSAGLRALAKTIASEQGVSLQEGVYIGVLGPSYETPAEIRMMRMLGADAVGMSTVPEVIAARHAGIEVLGISCISNMAAGILDRALSHEEVIATTEGVKEKFLQLVLGIIPRLDK